MPNITAPTPGDRPVDTPNALLRLTRQGDADSSPSAVPTTGTPTSGRGRIAYLDGVRAIAILAVLGVHWVYPYFGVFRGGYIGVDIFFVLSGFIITHILWRSMKHAPAAGLYRDFLVQRIRRLYPALLGLLVLGAVAMIVVGVPISASAALLEASIALIQGTAVYRGLGATGPAPFGLTWSLADEWVFYLIWPALILTALKAGLSGRNLAWVTVSLSVGMYLISVPSTSEWFYFGPTSRSAEILAGSAAALFIAENPRWRHRLNSRIAVSMVILAAVLIAAWVFLGSGEKEFAYRFVGYPLAVTAAVILASVGAVAMPNPAVAFLSLPPLTYLGRISYSLYLWHLLPVQLLDKDVLQLPTVVIGGMGVTIAFAATLASYYLLEKPFLRPRQRANHSNSN